MLKIRLTDTNKYLSLSPDTTVRIVLRSPFYFADGSDYGAEIMPTGFTFPFTIPLVGSNMAALNFPNAIQGAYTFATDIHCEIRVSDALILPGVLNVRSATRTTAEVDITVNIIPELKETLLNQLDLGSIDLSVVNPITRANATVNSPDAYDYIFSPVWNPSCRTEVENPTHQGSEFQNMYDGSGAFTMEVANGSALTPHPKIGAVLHKIFEANGYTVEASIFKRVELKWLLMYSAQTLVNEAGTVYSGVKQIAYGLPTVKASEFMRNICRRYCAAPFIDFFNKRVNILAFDDILKNNSSVDWSGYALTDYNIEIDRTYPKTFKDSNRETIVPQELSQYTQYAGLPAGYNDPEGIYKNTNNPRYHKMLTASLRRQETEVELDDYATATGGDGDYENAITPLQESIAFFNDNATRLALMPSLRQKCFYDEPTYTLDRVRLMAFRGWKDNGTYIYPYASSDITDINSGTVYVGWDVNPALGIPVLPAYAFTKFAATNRLWWSGTTGQFARFWYNNIEFIKQQKTVRRPMMPTLRAIMQTKFEDKIRIKSQLYFIKELDFVITASGTLKSCDATLITTF